MAKIDRKRAEALSESSTFFNLKKDGDKATIRFLYKDIDELVNESAYEVHEIRNPKFRLVDCIRTNPKDPLDVCPLCNRLSEKHEDKKSAEAAKAEGTTKSRLFVQVYNEDLGGVQIWARTLGLVKQLERDIEEDLDGRPLYQAPITVKRIGDGTDTDYSFSIVKEKVEMNGKYYNSPMFDEKTLEDFPNPLDVFEAKQLRKWDYKTMEKFIETRVLPDNDDETSQAQQSSGGEKYRRRSEKKSGSDNF